MKSYRQQKRKITEITKEQDECMGVSSKRCVNGTRRGNQKATESIRTSDLEPQGHVQAASAKIKLQLFPINEQTRLGLEKDGHNPFLELTLSTRKKISSVVRHLDSKWGSSNVAVGLLMLFPYNMKSEQVALCKRWTSTDAAVTAREVYVDVGSPPIFRLRYGWCSNLTQVIVDIPPSSSLLKAHTDADSRRGCIRDSKIPNHQEGKIDGSCETNKKHINVNESLCSDLNESKDSAADDVKEGELATDVVPSYSTVPWDDTFTNLSIGGLLSEISLHGKINGSDPKSVNKSSTQQVGPVSDISIGALLTEASLLQKMNNPSTKPENESSLQQIFLASSDISVGGLLSEASLLSSQSKLDKRITEAGHVQFLSPWDDNFTNLSIGGLLSEVSLQAKACGKPELNESKSTIQPDAPLCNLSDTQPYPHSQMSESCHENLSILDAEETCHGFPIRELQPSRDATASNASATSSGWSDGTSTKLFQFPKMVNETKFPKEPSCQELKINHLPCPQGACDEDSSLRPFRQPSAAFMT